MGSGVSMQATTSVQPWGSLDSCSTINAFVGGDVGSEGVFGKRTGSLMGITRKNGKALPLGLSVLETEASIESNPTHNSPTAVADSNHSDSPAMDLPELQAGAHLAINHMLSVRRSSELKRQQAIWDYEALLHQREAETAATNERAKIACWRKSLQARAKCAKAVMRAKCDYWVAVQ